jgi:thiol-disulfide isomerase/thioredoxin
MLRVVLAFAAICCAAEPKLKPVDEAAFQTLIHSQKGNVVLVDFWATWCSPCREEMPILSRLDAKLRTKKFKLITVSADEPEQEEQAYQFLKQNGVVTPAYIKRAKDDDAFINSIDPKWSGALPALFLFDRNGRKVKSFIGETEPAAIEREIQKIL